MKLTSLKNNSFKFILLLNNHNQINLLIQFLLVSPWFVIIVIKDFYGAKNSFFYLRFYAII